MPPPAANGMTSVMGRLGHSCANDAPAIAITAAEAVSMVARIAALLAVKDRSGRQQSRSMTRGSSVLASQGPVDRGRSAAAQEPRELTRLAVGAPQGRRRLD